MLETDGQRMPSSSSFDLLHQSSSMNVGEEAASDKEDRHDDTFCTSALSAARWSHRSVCCGRIVSSRPATTCVDRGSPTMGAGPA
jgi:hypothetical protein